jgi:hypothetical protein
LGGGLGNVVRYARWVNGRIGNPVTPFGPDIGGRVVERTIRDVWIIDLIIRASTVAER